MKSLEELIERQRRVLEDCDDVRDVLRAGTVEVDSEVGQGTTFWIELPGTAG